MSRCGVGAGAASAELLGQCHPRAPVPAGMGTGPWGWAVQGGWGWTCPSGCPQGWWVDWLCSHRCPSTAELAPGVALGPACGLPALPQPPGQGAGVVATRASSPSRGTAQREGCSPVSRAVGAAVQSVTSTPALSPADGGLFLLRNVPSPQILAGCRVCVTGERPRPGPSGG